MKRCFGVGYGFGRLRVGGWYGFGVVLGWVWGWGDSPQVLCWVGSCCFNGWAVGKHVQACFTSCMAHATCTWSTWSINYKLRPRLTRLI